MLIFKKIDDLKKHLKIAKKQGKTLGFVPTMGALHQGHVSLVSASNKVSDITICSIFINPTQFNDPSDFDKYPITIAADIEKLNDANCDILFLPAVAEMYPDGFKNRSRINFGFLAQTLEGEHRPGHFDGMAQIVEKLLKVTTPDFLFMGQKDFQQQLIVSQLIKKRKLNVKLVTCPTLREKDGLAMSSRNVRLNEDARLVSATISKTLKWAKKNLSRQDMKVNNISLAGLKKLQSSGNFEVEYFEVRNASTLKLPRKKTEKLVALVAAKIGGVRLIDNMLLN